MKPVERPSLDGKSATPLPRFGELVRNVPAVCYLFLIALLLGTAILYFTEMNFWRQQVDSKETDILQLVAKRLSGDIAPVVADLLILSEDGAFVDYLTEPTLERRERAADVFLTWARLKPDYFEIRYLKNDGWEAIRLDSVQGVPKRRPDAQLKDISKRYYFVNSIGLGRGEVFASAFDLTSVNGVVLQPRHPTIRFCTPVFDKRGEKRGVLIFDYEGPTLLAHLVAESSASNGQITLLNSEGYWLKGPRPADEWGFMEERTKDRSFRHDFKEEWKTIAGAEAGRFYSGTGLYAFRTFYPLGDAEQLLYVQGKAQTWKQGRNSPYKWKIVSVVPAAVLQAKARSIALRLLEVDLLGLVIFLWVSWNMARWRIIRGRSVEALKRQAELLDLAQDAIVVRSMDHTIQYWNAGAERLYGWSSDDVLGLNYMTILRPASDTPWAAVYESLLVKGQWSGEATAVHRDGTQIVSLNRLTLQRDRRGNPAAIMSIVTDIRERKRAEAELETAKRAAEAASRAKSEFLAVMSHEIRTPMNGVIGMAGLLLDTPLNPEQREYAETVRNSADALLTIINDILDFSKIEAGKMTIEPIPCDLRLAVEEVAELMAGRAREKSIDIILRYSPEAPRRIVCDPGRIRQILINLAGNAIKFTSKGHVYLSVVCEEKTAEQARLFFSVEDTGIGIPPDKLDHIFERFAQGDASTTRKFGGTGLGLAISKQLAELMGGTMGVESRPGEGSQFWMTLTLPLDASPEQEEELPQADLSGARVLGVDDNPTNLFVLREQLHSWGLRNDMCSSGADALRLLRGAAAAGDPYHIVILDEQMPEMDGETLGGIIKADPELRSTLLVMLTSLGLRGDAARLRALGFSAYLTKPTRQSQLFDALGTVWSGRAKSRPGQLVTRHTLAEARTASPAASSAPPEAQPGAAAVRGRILVVEDNAVNQKVASRLLEKMAYRVDVAANGKEAVAMIDLLPYDAVLMDCQMPVMDGYKATREIRSREGQGRHRVIIAMTANAMQGDREKCIEAGMDDYISKPIRALELAAILERYLAPWSPSGSTPTSERTAG